MRRFPLVAVVLAGVAVPCRAGRADDVPPRPGPRLVALVVVDQLSADLLERYGDRLRAYGRQGFLRLAREGAWWTEARHRHAATVTGPGHATIATGAYPSVHGIVGNEWWQRGEGDAPGRMVYCVEDPAAEVFGAPGAKDGARRVGPAHLVGDALGDAMKASLHPTPHVVALSLKDRAAILMGGRRADAAFWLDPKAGGFVTCDRFTLFREGSDAERAAARKDVEARLLDFDAKRLEPRVKAWEIDERVPFGYPESADDARKEEGPDAAFPHAPRFARDLEHLMLSPEGNDVLVDLLDALVPTGPEDPKAPRTDVQRRWSVGSRDGTTDLLAVSFSSPDAIGHRYGADSQEAEDDLVRLDRTLENLFVLLDRKVGRGRWIGALTADHGVAPIPEVAAASGLDAGRVLREDVRKAATDAPAVVEAVSDGNVWLGGDDPRTAERVRAALLRVPGVWRAYTRAQLREGRVPDDGPGRGAVLSYDDERSGDVVYQTKPYWLLDRAFPGTTHGSPWTYDARVPLFLYGPAVTAGPRLESADVVDLAATVAALLHVAPPAGASGRVLLEAIDVGVWRSTLPLR